jgi:hypothetical protein
MLQLVVYAFGTGISVMTGKRPYVNCESIDITSEQNFQDEMAGLLTKSKVAGDVTFVRNESFNQMAQPVAIEKFEDLLKCQMDSEGRCILFILPAKNSYSNIQYPQLAKHIEFPQNPSIHKLSKFHHQTLTAVSTDTLDKAIAAMKEFVEKTPAFLSAMERVSHSMIKELQRRTNFTTPQVAFNEATRRVVIDVILYAGLELFSDIFGLRQLDLEQELLHDKPLPQLANLFLGSGKLDYWISGGVIVARSPFDDFATEDVPTEPQLTECISSSHAATEEANLNVPVEGKDEIEDKALYQLGAQLRDAMYVRETSVDRSSTKRCLDGNAKVCQDKVVGLLCTGHTWEVYGMTHQAGKSVMSFLYHGKRVIKVLRYLSNTSRTSSFKMPHPKELQSEQVDTVEICPNETKELLYLLLVVMKGDL